MGAPPPTGPPPPFEGLPGGGGGGACAKSANPEIIKIAVIAKIFFIVIVFKFLLICFLPGLSPSPIWGGVGVGFYFFTSPPAPSPKREGEARLLGFVVFYFWFFASALTNNPTNFGSLPQFGEGPGMGLSPQNPLHRHHLISRSKPCHHKTFKVHFHHRKLAQNNGFAYQLLA